MHTSRGDLLIRTTQKGDGENLRALRLEGVTNHPSAFSTTAEETTKLSIDDWDERAARSTGEGLETIHVAIDTSGNFAGMTGIYCGKNSKDRHASMIWGVYIRPTWRGVGLADALVNASVDWARTKNCSFVKLTCNTQNAPALRCYQRLGFRIYAIDPATIRHDGIDYDEALMIHPL